jgi:hypothetical protein
LGRLWACACARCLTGGCLLRRAAAACGRVQRRRGLRRPARRLIRPRRGGNPSVSVCVGVFAWTGRVVPAAGCGRGRGLLLCMAGARAKQGHSVDALAPGGDEGRGTLRKAMGSREQALIRGCPNGATHPFGVASPESIGWCGEPGELKHLSTRRNRHQATGSHRTCPMGTLRFRE